MAFASMMLVFIVFAFVILGILLIAGLAVLIVGIVTRTRPKNKGKKFPKVLIVIGSIVTSIPVCTVLVIVIGGIASGISASIKRESYTSVTDKWRNEWVTDHQAADGAIKELLEAAEAGDREQFKRTFTPNIQSSQSFEAAVDVFFDNYPKGLKDCKLEGGNVSSSGSYNYGHNVQSGSTHYTCILNGNWYSIYLSFCYENTDSPDDVGVDFFSVENLEAAALRNDHEGENLVCEIKSEDEITARLIKNMAFIFEPYPNRVITEEQMKEYLKKYDDLDDLEQEIGKPNVSIKYSNSTGCDHYYELAPENGEPRYAYICADWQTGRFFYGYVCSDTQSYYDRKLIEED